MKTGSFIENLSFSDDRVSIKPVLDTPFSKEVCIMLKEGQHMKEHKTPFPIVVHLISGTIDFGVHGEVHALKEGAILTLDGGVPHDLKATADSVVRLTILKADSSARVEKVAEDSK